MDESFDDGAFWLPPQFLNDDDDNMTRNKSMNNKDALGYGNGNLTSSGYGSNNFSFPSSEFNSPVESVVSSSETESDEDDAIFGLTRQLAYSTLENPNPKDLKLSGSPQSTLCGCKQGFSQTRPSPPSTATWDLLHAAAGEVARMRMNEVMSGFSNNSGLFGPPSKQQPSPVSVPVKTQTLDCGFYPHQSLSHQKLQALRYQQLKNQQILRQQQLQRSGSFGEYKNQLVENRDRAVGFGLSPVTWPPLQQAQQKKQEKGSGMRAIFIGNPAAKSQYAGTGVFLPRRAGIYAETRKKPACSTVLMPARVVQALNLNLEEINAESQFQGRVNETYTPMNDPHLRLRNNNFVSQPRRNLRLQPQPGMINDIRLPSEWTY
jgi:hypothetical protein